MQLDDQCDLNLGRLSAIRRRVDTPLVLHGGSGIADGSLAEAIAIGVAKVNYGTYLKQRCLAAIRRALSDSERRQSALFPRLWRRRRPDGGVSSGSARRSAGTDRPVGLLRKGLNYLAETSPHCLLRCRAVGDFSPLAVGSAMGMTSKQRILIALQGGMPDRLPATTHFLMPQFLNACMGGISEDEFFDTCGWDPITYTTPHRPDPAKGEYYDPNQAEPGFLESRRIATDQWRVRREPIAGREHPAARYRFATPKGDAHHGSGVRSLYGLGGRAAGEGETRHRLHRASTPPRRSATWRP